MNDNILCLYYSRTGNTKKAMEEVAESLDCECLEIRDKVDRSGTMGYLRCCFDAMHKRTSAVSRPKCARPLSDYKLVILGHARVGGPLFERYPRFFEAPRL